MAIEELKSKESESRCVSKEILPEPGALVIIFVLFTFFLFHFGFSFHFRNAHFENTSLAQLFSWERTREDIHDCIRKKRIIHSHLTAVSGSESHSGSEHSPRERQNLRERVSPSGRNTFPLPMEESSAPGPSGLSLWRVLNSRGPLWIFRAKGRWCGEFNWQEYKTAHEHVCLPALGPKSQRNWAESVA